MTNEQLHLITNDKILPEQKQNLKKLKNISDKKIQKALARQQKAERKKEIENSVENQLERLAQQQKYPKTGWYKLDNAGLIFPAATISGGNFMFRVAALLKNAVDPILLQQAVNMVIGRFPTMISAIRRGVFWYYLEAPSIPIIARKLTDYPCKQVALDSRRSQLGITYNDYEIAVEVFHSATDGAGALKFLNCLIACYLSLNGVNSSYNYTINHNDMPDLNELEDSFISYANDKKTKIESIPDACKIKGTAFNNTDAVVYVKGICHANQVKMAASKYDATVTQLLAACYIKALHENKKHRQPLDTKPVNLVVPVDLRKIYKSNTLRNFSLVMHIVSRCDTDLIEIISHIKETFKQQYREEYLQKYINFNTSLSKKALFKCLPLPIKNVAMAIGFRLFSSKNTTSSFSNLGIVKTEQQFNDYIHRYEFTFGQQKSSAMLSAITFNNIMTITITKGILETDIEQSFFRQLTSLGIEIAIESNLNDQNRREGI